MDSVVLGLASPLMVDVEGKVLGFEQNLALKDAILDPSPARLKQP
jgi:hypothetical protein